MAENLSANETIIYGYKSARNELKSKSEAIPEQSKHTQSPCNLSATTSPHWISFSSSVSVSLVSVSFLSTVFLVSVSFISIVFLVSVFFYRLCLHVHRIIYYTYSLYHQSLKSMAAFFRIFLLIINK